MCLDFGSMEQIHSKQRRIMVKTWQLWFTPGKTIKVAGQLLPKKSRCRFTQYILN